MQLTLTPVPSGYRLSFVFDNRSYRLTNESELSEVSDFLTYCLGVKCFNASKGLFSRLGKFESSNAEYAEVDFSKPLAYSDIVNDENSFLILLTYRLQKVATAFGIKKKFTFKVKEEVVA